jgi:hypothetical protein
LTYNAGQDRAPAWLPDESGIVYSFERTDRPDHDRCLGVLPPDGGQLRREICHGGPAADDSTDVLTEPAPRADGWVAYLDVQSAIGATVPSSVTLLKFPLTDPTHTVFVQKFPYLADTVLYNEGTQLRWLDSTSLLYVAQRVGHEGRRSADTVRTGGEIVRIVLMPEIVGGTSGASSLAVGDAVLYFTLNDDSRVIRRDLVTGTDSTVFDFGAGNVARDVQVVGSRLVAVVGGHVAFAYDSALSYSVQYDSGGPVHVVDLATGADSVIAPPDAVFRRPALSPSGKRLVVEQYACIIPPGQLGPPCRVITSSDLWEYSLP